MAKGKKQPGNSPLNGKTLDAIARAKELANSGDKAPLPPALAIKRSLCAQCGRDLRAQRCTKPQHIERLLLEVAKDVELGLSSDKANAKTGALKAALQAMVNRTVRDIYREAERISGSAEREHENDA